MRSQCPARTTTVSVCLLLLLASFATVAAAPTAKLKIPKPATAAPRAAKPANVANAAKTAKAAAPAATPTPKVAVNAGFYTVTPCRVLDTRQSSPLQAGVERTIPVVGGTCGVPADATAVMLVASAVTPSAAGHIQLYPSPPPPTTSTINFPPMNPNAALSNNSVVELTA
ncbi:MAG TPA: hypothetical protein VGR07_01580, partial [Thermoanaerobaculia bacterium]|nr:hypothetical protein [Thermoanaerobaculia bacterium]